MKYYVIAKKWDNEKKMQVNYIAGVFPTYHNAEMFRIAYNDYYDTNALILHESKLARFPVDTNW